MEVTAKTVAHGKLLRLGLGIRELARTIGVTPPAAQRYLRGERTPDATMRARLEEVHGIPRQDWDVSAAGVSLLKPKAAKPPPPPREPTPRPRYTEAPPPPPPPPRATQTAPQSDALQDQARFHLSEVRAMRQNAEELGQLDFALKLLDLERKAILDLAKFTRELTPADESRLCETSAWMELRGRIIRALADFPEAARAVVEALGE